MHTYCVAGIATSLALAPRGTRSMSARLAASNDAMSAKTSSEPFDGC